METTVAGEVDLDERFQLRAMEVRAIRREADDVVSIQLVNADGSQLPSWSPGAHVDLVLSSGLMRQYSLCGDPADRSSLTVAVLREADGRGGSVEVHDTVVVGSTLDVRGPRNHFKLRPADEYLLIAGGIGITPILTMARQLAADGTPFRLLYGGRSRRTMAFVNQLSALGSAIEVVPEDEAGLLDLDAALRNVSPSAHVYCCGPEGLLRALDAAGAARGLPVHVERFAAQGSTGAATPESAIADAAGDTFDVELRRSGATVQVGPDRTILDAVRDVIPDVGASCEEGFCGACETRVLEGIPDHRDEVLDDEERASNTAMMICVGRSLSKRLVLDL